jgi:transcriptional regulator GlxA family with amidase domain
MAPAFRQRDPHIELEPARRLVAEPTVVCAGATTAYLHLAIHLIERAAGHAFAVFVAKHLIVDTNTSPQAPYFLLHPMKQHGDPDILALQEWIEAHYRDEVTTSALADQGGMSERSLSRRFRSATGESPRAYIRRVRIEVAKRLLESESLTIDQITDRVGYVDQRSFARLFKQTTGVSPGEYRRRFGC